MKQFKLNVVFIIH